MTNSDDNKTGFGLSQFQRNRYFYGKLMTVNDFDSEQGYMNEKRHLLNRLVSGAGVICGLRPDQDDVEISNAGGNIKIKFVTGGAAIDGWGREIVIPIEDSPRDIWIKQGSTQVNLTLTDLESAQYYLYLEYDPREGEMVSSASESSGCEETCCPSRVIENFQVIASATAPDTLTIACPDFTGESTEDDAKKKVKKWLMDQTSKLCGVPVESKIFFLALKKGGSLLIDQQKTAQYITFVANNRALSELLACHLSDFDNPHKTTAVQVGALKSVDGVESPGGDIDLVGKNAIEISPDNEAKSIVITENHSTIYGNPHETKHEEILEALPIYGDDYNEARNKHVSNNDAKKWDGFGDLIGVKTINYVNNPGGNVDLIPKDSIVITPNDVANTIAIGETHSAMTGNPHQTTAAQVGALSIKGGTVEGNVTVSGNVGIGTTNPDAKLQVKGGAIMPEAGKNEQSGILFPRDPGGGTWDRAWVRYYARSGEDTTLEIGISNDPYDHIALMPSGNVGIGTTNPGAKLQVQGGAIMPAIGNDEESGILFPRDPGGGTWDRAWIRYYARYGESTTFEIGTSDNIDDHIALMPSGNVGIGTTNPGAKLEIVADSLPEKDWNEAIRLGQSYNSAITYPSGGLLFGLHSERRFYFADTVKQNYIMIIDANPDGGNVWAKNRSGGGIDYAEYFESKDGKEIKPGTPVVLDGDKIRPAKKGETPFGIISANPLIAGGVPIEWPKKYLRDEFGNQIMEEYQEEIMVPKKEKVKKERQKMEKKTIKEKVIRTDIVEIKGKYCQKEVINTIEREIQEPVFKEVDLYDAKGKEIIGKHRIPVMENYEEEITVLDEKGQPVLVGTGKFDTKTRAKINPGYDEKKEYIPREKRPEWNCVGLLGQLPLLKGQPTAPTWVKIKDLTKDVELWLVK